MIALRNKNFDKGGVVDWQIPPRLEKLLRKFAEDEQQEHILVLQDELEKRFGWFVEDFAEYLGSPYDAGRSRRLRKKGPGPLPSPSGKRMIALLNENPDDGGAVDWQIPQLLEELLSKFSKDEKQDHILVLQDELETRLRWLVEDFIEYLGRSDDDRFRRPRKKDPGPLPSPGGVSTRTRVYVR
jgi:hypothetical protein